MAHIRELIAELGISKDDIILCGFAGYGKPFTKGTTWGTSLQVVVEENVSSTDNPLSYAIYDGRYNWDEEGKQGNLAVYNKKKLKAREYPGIYISNNEFEILQPSALIARIKIIV